MAAATAENHDSPAPNGPGHPGADLMDQWLWKPELTGGELRILNVGKGDVHFHFSGDDPKQLEDGKAMLADAQRRGYAILVKMADGSYRRMVEFDAKAELYIVSGLPPETPDQPGTPVESPANAEQAGSTPTLEPAPAPVRKRRGRKPRTEVPMQSASAIAIAPSAGG